MDLQENIQISVQAMWLVEIARFTPVICRLKTLELPHGYLVSSRFVKYWQA
jgi:hypothetical protein